MSEEAHEVRIIPPGFPSARRFHLAQTEGLCLHGEIGFSVDIGCIDGDMPQPGSDGVDIDSCTEQVSCRCVSDHVRSDVLLLHFRDMSHRPQGMARDHIVNAEARQRLAIAIEEQRFFVSLLETNLLSAAAVDGQRGQVRTLPPFP